MGERMTLARLQNYISLRREVENYVERIARMKNNELIPAIKQGDESKRTGGASDRMANAVVRRLDYQDQMHADVSKKLDELDAVLAAIDRLPDPMEREVLRLRYTDGDPDDEGRIIFRHMRWQSVAMRIYGDDSESKQRSARRIHDEAVQHIAEV